MASSELLFCQTRDTDGRWERADGSVRELRPGVQSDALVVRMAAAGACRAMRWWLGWLRLCVGIDALVVRMAAAGRVERCAGG